MAIPFFLHYFPLLPLSPYNMAHISFFHVFTIHLPPLECKLFEDRNLARIFPVTSWQPEHRQAHSSASLTAFLDALQLLTEDLALGKSSRDAAFDPLIYPLNFQLRPYLLE